MTENELLDATVTLLELPVDEMGVVIGQTLMVCLVALAYTNEESLEEAKANLALALDLIEAPEWDATRVGLANILERRAHA